MYIVYVCIDHCIHCTTCTNDNSDRSYSLCYYYKKETRITRNENVSESVYYYYSEVNDDYYAPQDTQFVDILNTNGMTVA